MGINEITHNNFFTISPNPFTTSFILQIDGKIKDAEVTIYNVLGEELMRKNVIDNRMEIEKGNLASGIYFVSVTDNERQFVQKIIIQ